MSVPRYGNNAMIVVHDHSQFNPFYQQHTSATGHQLRFQPKVDLIPPNGKGCVNLNVTSQVYCIRSMSRVERVWKMGAPQQDLPKSFVACTPTGSLPVSFLQKRPANAVTRTKLTAEM